MTERTTVSAATDVPSIPVIHTQSGQVLAPTADRREVENLRDLVKRVETFRERMVNYGGPTVAPWADVLDSILAVRNAVHPDE